MKKISRRHTPVADLALKSKRTPLSCRVKEDTLKALKAAAKENKTSLSDLAAAVLDDYAEWLLKESK